jgi:AcrR family transcriptional regulator
MTLQKVAAEADVPLGNVNYYFRTKEDLIEDVLEAHKTHLRGVFARWDEASPDPRQRLRMYLGAQARNAEKIVQDGCQHARLAFDLNQHETFRHRAGEIIDLYIRWAHQQFELAGADDPAIMATDLVARVQGAIAVASTMRRTDVLTDVLERVESWLDAQWPQDGVRGDARLGTPSRYAERSSLLPRRSTPRGGADRASRS